MTFPRKIGLLLILVAAIATAAEFTGLQLPTLRWFYSFDADPNLAGQSWWLDHRERVVGFAMCGAMALVGLAMIALGGGFHWNPLTLRKIERFRSIGRGYFAYRVLLVLLVLTMLDQVLVGKRALAVRHGGEWYFPAFREDPYPESTFGGEGDEETNYRLLAERAADGETLVILPPIPWDPTFDSDEQMERILPMIAGRVHTPDGKTPYDGYAFQYREGEAGEILREGRLRQGIPRWSVDVYGPDGELAGREEWEGGEVVSSDLPEGFEAPEGGAWVRKIYPPLPPSLKRRQFTDPAKYGWEHRHLLGTDKKGWDIAAQLYGGLQVIFKSAALYLALTYGIGITFGCLMGYFGGTYDLIMQRVMEVMLNVPFLLVVMILSANIGRDNITLGTILLIFCIFSWIQVAIYLRTATYKEKARDYASAARVLGAGTGRVIFRHILPNAVATIVTLVPFSVSSVITALTALDFLGFGVPDSYPSWGRILNDGVENLGSPWIVSSVFAMLVILLLTITFIGEAIREAFDPKKFTTYQ